MTDIPHPLRSWKPFISEDVLHELKRIIDEHWRYCCEYRSEHYDCEECPWYDPFETHCFGGQIESVLKALKKYCHVTTTRSAQNFTAYKDGEVVLNLENVEITSFKEVEDD